MNTNYAAPIEVRIEDCSVPVDVEFETLLMVWTLRSMNPAKDLLTTLSWAIQFDGYQYLVVERVDGTLPQDHMGRSFTDKDEALSYWSQQIRYATPPCRQVVLPGFVSVIPDYIETYAYYTGFNNGPAFTQSHARTGGWS